MKWLLKKIKKDVIKQKLIKKDVKKNKKNVI